MKHHGQTSNAERTTDEETCLRSVVAAGVIQRRVSLIAQPTSTPAAAITAALPERGWRAKKGVCLGNEVKVEIKRSGTMGSNFGMKGSEVRVYDFTWPPLYSGRWGGKISLRGGFSSALVL